MRPFRIFLSSFFFLAAATCGPRIVTPPRPPPPPFQRIVVAVLPFENSTPDMDAPQALRRELAPRLQSKAYELQNPGLTDATLREMGITLAGQLKGVKVEELRAKLGVDALVTGAVHQATSIVTGVYNRRSLEAEVVLTDARTGNVIWSMRDKVIAEDSPQGNTGLDFAKSALRGVERSDLSREAARLANIAVNRMPLCPRQGDTMWNGRPLPLPVAATTPAVVATPAATSTSAPR